MGCMYTFSLTSLISEKEGSTSLKQTLPDFVSLPILFLFGLTSIITHKYSFIRMHLQLHILLLIYLITNSNLILTLLAILVTIYNACICFCSVPNFLICGLSLVNVICSGPYFYHCTKIASAQHCS